MNPKLLFILAVLFMGVAFGLSKVGGSDPETQEGSKEPEAEQEDVEALYPYDLRGAQEILVHRTDTLDLLRIVPGATEGSWQLTEPMVDRAEPALLSQLFQTLTLNSFAAPEASWSERTDAELGLSEPRVTLEIVHESEPLYRMLIGTRHPDGARAFASVNGKRCMVPLALSEVLTRSDQLWRDHGIIEGPRAVNELIWEPKDGPRLHMTRQGSDWTLQEPVEGPLDPLRIGMLHRLLGARSSELAVDPIEEVVRVGMKENAGRLTLRGPRGKDRSPYTQVLYVRAGVMVDENRAFAMPAYSDDLALLSTDPTQLRSQRLLDFEPRHISSLRLTRPTGAVEYRRGSRGWTNVDGDLLPAKARKDLTAHLVALANLEATEARARPEGVAARQVMMSIANRVVDRGAVVLRYWPLAEGGTVVTSGTSSESYFVDLDLESFWNALLAIQE